jgi:hypothetical protein
MPLKGADKMSQGTRFLKGARVRTLAQGFFGWFNPNNFMDVYQEWHAFVEGFCEVLCPWPARHQLTGELLTDLNGEHHYYVFGRVIGVIAWLIIATIIKAALF